MTWRANVSPVARFCCAVMGAGFGLLHSALAQTLPPVALTPAASPTNNQITLAWPAVSGATGYNVKRSLVAGGPHTLLGNVVTNNYTDATAQLGTNYFYAVTTVSNAVESAAFREAQAMVGVVGDNSDAAGVVLTGSWSASAVAGFYGVNSVFAATTNGSVPSATCTFAPTLITSANYDIYLRWTANANRPTNAPVDIAFADGQTTVAVDQTTNGGVWMLLGTFPCDAGNSNRVTIRNNTGSTGKSVVADAVQFVPRLSPLAADTNSPGDYTLVVLNDNFNGTSVNASVWGTFAGRVNYSVSNGKLRLQPRYIGAVPISSATTNELYNEANWMDGGIVTDQAAKFGYHEARLRLPPLPARGVDTAYWHTATDELLTGYEIDAPEFFNKDSSGAVNNYGFGVWDHIDGARTWDYTRNWSTLGDVTQFITIGLEWRTDNSQIVYINGTRVHTATNSGMNATESILPANIILSTKVLDWLRPNTNLNSAEATWDYARFYQKPGWLGRVDGQWTNVANWGADGLPGPGVAAVFNLSNAPAIITLATNQSLQSIFVDGFTPPAHVFNGPGALQLGVGRAGDASVTHGGILINTSVGTDQTFNVPMVGQQSLQFANLSRAPGTELVLNGLISGSGAAPDVSFITPMTASTNVGVILLGQSLGSGLRHVNKAGDPLLTLPAGCLHTGELRVARGPVSIPAVSSLGITSNSAVIFRPRYKHSESWRPRLTYTGAAATSFHPIVLGGWQADGALESSGTGPLAWFGNVFIAPSAEIPTQVLTRDAKLTLGGTAGSGENIFYGSISDAGVTVAYKNADGTTNTGPARLTLEKAGSSSWWLAGSVSVSNAVPVNAGRLVIGSGTNGSLLTPSLNVASGAEAGWGRDDSSATFNIPITGAGGFRKLGAGTLMLTAANTYTGTTTVDAGILLNTNTGSGALTVNGGVFDLNGANRTSGQVVLSGGSITNSSGGNNFYLTGSPVDLQSGSISARIGGNGSVVKSTPGTVILTGGNTFLGGTIVSNGTLLLNSPGLLGSAVTVSGGTFGGNGTVDDLVTINSGTHAPGAAPGVMTVNSNYTLNVSGTLQIEIFGPTPVTQYDQLKITGASSLVTLAGALEIVTTNTLSVGTTFGIITNTGSLAVNGTFANRAQGSGFVAGNTNWFRINYTGGSGNDVFLTRIATPSAPILSAIISNSLPRLTFAGTTNVNYQVLASTNLVSWVPILTTNPPVLPFSWADSAATNFPARFYRVTIGL